MSAADANASPTASANRRGGTRRLALIGIAAALSFVLGLAGWTAPSGGRVSLADIPILALALVEGWEIGLLAGAVAGLLHYPQQPVTVHPLSLLLDYPASAACLGLAGLVPRRLAPVPRAALGVGLAVGVKALVHVWSGVLFWSQGLEGAAAWRFSLLYNATYMGPMLLVDLIVMVGLGPRLRRLSPRRGQPAPALPREGDA